MAAPKNKQTRNNNSKKDDMNSNMTSKIVVPEAPKDLQRPTMQLVRSNPTEPRGRLNDVLALMEGHTLSPIMETARDIVNKCKQSGTEPPDWCVIVLVGTFDVVTARDWNALRDNVA